MGFLSTEDLVQKAFMKLVEQSKRPENPMAWLCKTICHTVQAGPAKEHRF